MTTSRLYVPHQITVRLAALTYEDYSDIEAGAARLNVSIDRYIERDGTEAVLFVTEEGVYILSIRGTEFSKGHIGDVLSNAGIFAHSWEGPGGVHRGYHEQFLDIKDIAVDYANSV